MAGPRDNTIIGAWVCLLQYFGVAKDKGRIALSIKNQCRNLRPVEWKTIKPPDGGDDLSRFFRPDHPDSILHEVDAFFRLSHPTMISEALIDQMGKPPELWYTEKSGRRCYQADGLVQNFVG